MHALVQKPSSTDPSQKRPPHRPMPSTAENVAQEFQISREDQDAFALRSQKKTAAAQANGRLAAEIVAVGIPQRKGDAIIVDKDEHPRLTSLDKLAALKPIVRKDGSVTAGNASGVNDGAAAIIIASEEAAKRHGLTPRARILGAAVAGVPPRIMGVQFGVQIGFAVDAHLRTPSK